MPDASEAALTVDVAATDASDGSPSPDAFDSGGDAPADSKTPEASLSPDGANETGADGGLILDPEPCGPSPPGAPSTQVLDLGHGSMITLMRQSATRLLTRDYQSHWVLWNMAKRARVLIGDSPFAGNPPPTDATSGLVDLRGGTLAAETSFGTVALYDATTGALLTSVSAPMNRFGLATDGSYLWGASETKLIAWSTTGMILVDHDGDYRTAKIHGAPGELRVAGGPAGANVIQLFDTSTGSASTSPSFSGTFHSWFLDGASFLTRTGNTVWVYPKSASSPTGIFALPTVENLTGQGNFFWTYQVATIGYPINIYSIAGDSTPVLTLSGAYSRAVVGSSDTIGVVSPGPDQLRIVHLGTSTPTVTTHAIPDQTQRLSMFAASTSGEWSVGNDFGVVYDSLNLSLPGTHSLGCGAAWSVTGAENGTVAIATASSGIVIADVSTTPPSILGRIPFSSSQVEISSSGTTLLAAQSNTIDSQFSPDQTLKAFALPSGTEVNRWVYDQSVDPTLFDFSFARNAPRFGRVTGSFISPNWQFSRIVTDLAGNATGFSDKGTGMPDYTQRIHISPDGTLVAVRDTASPAPTTRIYKDAQVVNAISGWPLAWMDDNRLLVQIFTQASFGPVYARSEVYDSAGVLHSSAVIHQMSALRETVAVASATQIYDTTRRTTYDVTTGAAVWSSAATNFDTELGTIAGAFVVAPDRYRVIAEPR